MDDLSSLAYLTMSASQKLERLWSNIMSESGTCPNSVNTRSELRSGDAFTLRTDAESSDIASALWVKWCLWWVVSDHMDTPGVSKVYTLVCSAYRALSNRDLRSHLFQDLGSSSCAMAVTRPI